MVKGWRWDRDLQKGRLLTGRDPLGGSRVSHPQTILFSVIPNMGSGGVFLPYTEHGLGWSFPPLHRAWARGSLGCSFIPPGTRALSRGRLILALGFGFSCFRVWHIKTLFIMLIGLSLWVCPCLSLSGICLRWVFSVSSLILKYFVLIKTVIFASSAHLSTTP